MFPKSLTTIIRPTKAGLNKYACVKSVTSSCSYLMYPKTNLYSAVAKGKNTEMIMHLIPSIPEPYPFLLNNYNTLIILFVNTAEWIYLFIFFRFDKRGKVWRIHLSVNELLHETPTCGF